MDTRQPVKKTPETNAAAHKKGSRVRNEVNLDPVKPIPIEFAGLSYVAINGSGYIPFLYPKDNFFATLLEARLLSVTQNACISTITNYAVGEGVYIKNLTKEQKVDPNFTNLMKYANAKRQNMNSILRQVFDSYKTFGNVPIEIVRGMAGGKKFLYVYPKNLLDCRLAFPDKDDEVKAMIYSKYFRRSGWTYDRDKVKEIPLYKCGPGNKASYWLEDGRVQRTALWLSNEVAGYDYYGMPSSVSSISHQKLEYDTVRFNLDNIENNMVMGGAIFLTGNMSEDEANKITNQIIKRHTGAGKRGRIGVYSSEQDITDAKFVQFDTHKDGSYVELDDKVQSKIIFSNEWDSVLAGLAHTGSLGKGAGYMEQIYSQKLQTVIRPLQNKIVDGFLDPLMEICDEWFGTQWATTYDLDIKPLQIINKSTELITTVNGLNAYLNIVYAVAEGALPLDAAIKLVVNRFGLTEDEATEQLGAIKVNPNVQRKSTAAPGSDNPSGGN